jgi:imidazole glycerol phosphate synthase subunit HisF
MVPVYSKSLLQQIVLGLVLIITTSTYLFLFQVSGGRDIRPIGAYELAIAVEELGAGEILLNCIDCDGMFSSCLALHSQAMWHSSFSNVPCFSYLTNY